MSRADYKRHLARKYARAFLRLFDEFSKEELFSTIDALAAIYEKHPLAFHTLELSSARIEDKCDGLHKITESLNLQKPMTRLLDTMLRQKNLNLIPFLLPSLKEEYKKIHQHHDVVVTSAQELSTNHKRQLEGYLSKTLSGVLSFIYREDETLIAGIKVQTPTHYWEYSIARTIRMLEHGIRQQETI